MNNLALKNNYGLAPTSKENLEKLFVWEEIMKKLPQVDIETHHLLHAGMYARSIKIPEGTVLMGSYMKIPTILIIQGTAIVYMDGKSVPINGYNIFAGAAFRKQACIAVTDVYSTMLFVTDAKTVEEAEKEFTDQYEELLSKQQDVNITMITKE